MTVLIVGGGLSGLALADALEREGRDYRLVEARARFGGRIKTETCSGGAFDMGPAWFWPGQPRIAALIEDLGLSSFQQYAKGELLFEGPDGQVERGRGFASMQGSLRVEGGLAALTTRLADRLPDQKAQLNAPVKTLSTTNDGVAATLENGDVIEAKQIVLALPPRIAATVQYAPQLPETTLDTMLNIPTWMAGHAKAVAVYDTPFWRDAGLSGDASSRHGPMVEIHDASPAQGGPYALFGFIGIPPQGRSDMPLLRQHVIAQLVRLFGDAAAAPQKLLIKDWAFDPLTATALDQAPLYAHPTYRLPQQLQGLWQNRLLFAGTEVASQFGGYLEGALEAAENALDALNA